MNTALWAVAIDLLCGEPPASLHPTVHMGRFITRNKPRIRERPTRAFARGTAIAAGGLAASALFGALLDAVCNQAPSTLRSILRGAALKPALSLRPLLSAAHSIERALIADDLVEARRLLAWHLVSRDTSSLSLSEVAGATIESIAENLSDSFIAPLLMYHFGNLPAAYAYRFANTADAMLGYRTPELEWLGKPAARIDDLLNIIPARVTALAIGLAAPIAGGSTQNALRVACRDARRTSSPNAGWPMAAMAGALNCQLTKRDVYTLNGTAAEPTVQSIRRARHIVSAAAALAIAGMSLIDD